MSDRNLVDIYAAVADRVITMETGKRKKIKAWGLDQVKNRVVGDHLPIRIVLPPGADGGSAIEEFDIVTFDSATITWRITDLMLYQSAGRGGGLRNIWQVLTEYVWQYTSYFNANRTIGNGQLVGLQPQAGIFEWPRGSGTQFHGVNMVVQVMETLC